MYENFNQPTFTNAKALHEYTERQEKIKTEQKVLKAKEKAEEKAFQNAQISLAKESNKTAKIALVLSVLAIITTVLTTIVQYLFK